LYLYALMNHRLRTYHNYVVATSYIIDLDCMSYLITFIIVDYPMMRGSV
jgi:general stress protein CsbA